LLAHKAGVRTFDLSSGMNYVSMKDQLVRAITLIDSLKNAGALELGKFVGSKSKGNFDLVVVGAGVAGVTAATYANDLGYSVLLTEKSDSPFRLQKKCTSRYVSFTMYDWPEPFANVGIFPSMKDQPVKKLNQLNPKSLVCEVNSPVPVQAAILANDWTKNLEEKLANKAVDFELSLNTEVLANPKSTKTDLFTTGAKTIDVTLREIGQVERKVTTQVLVFATGIGIEKTVSDGTVMQPVQAFWEDMVNPPWASFDPQKTAVISGSGDGSIQDFLKICFRDDSDNLLKLVENLTSPSQRMKILAAERHAAREILWAVKKEEVYESLQSVYTEVVQSIETAELLEIKKLISKHEHYRPKIVWIFQKVINRVPIFSKSYPLNRFLATLTLRILDRKSCEILEGELVKVSHGENAWDCTVSTSNGSKKLESNFEPMIRHGVNSFASLGNNENYAMLRNALAGAPLPFKPHGY
jgi:hypothetical protein